MLFRSYKDAFLLTPNFSEFTAVVKKSNLSEKDILVEGTRLIKKLNLEALVITRSEKGMSIITRGNHKVDIATAAQEVFDITGAGDTVISMLSVAIASGLDIEEAVILANYAAGIVVGKVGTSTVTLPEVSSVVERRHPA